MSFDGVASWLWRTGEKIVGVAGLCIASCNEMGLVREGRKIMQRNDDGSCKWGFECHWAGEKGKRIRPWLGLNFGPTRWVEMGLVSKEWAWVEGNGLRKCKGAEWW